MKYLHTRNILPLDGCADFVSISDQITVKILQVGSSKIKILWLQLKISVLSN